MKNQKKIWITVIIILFLILLSSYYYKNKYIALVEKESEINTHDWYKKTLKQYDIELCNFSITKPEYVLITEEDILGDGNLDYELLYYKITNTFSFSQHWDVEYTGGTTVKNTTFDELVKMVKEDCSQFQEGHCDYYGEDLTWSYSPYEPEPEKTQEEIIYEQNQEKALEFIREAQIASGKREEEPTFSSNEEGLRYNGVSEDEIKRILKEDGIEYVGPQ